MTHAHQTLLEDGLVLDAASGAAPPAVRLLAACHSELNEAAARRFQTAEAAFGILLEDGPTAPVSTDLYARTVAQFDAEDRQAPPTRSDGTQTLPKALSRVLPSKNPIVWRRRFGGMREHVVDAVSGPDAFVRLLNLPKGWKAPQHAHGGDEITLVLSGAFRDEAGRYGAGDVSHAASGFVHRPVVDGDEDCLCLVVEFGQLQPTNLALSLAGRVLGRLF
jgi:putative transcriptional regulator